MKPLLLETFTSVALLFVLLWLAHVWSNRPSAEEQREQMLVAFALKG